MTGVLLLNADYSVLRAVAVRRAIVLVLAEKAEVLEERDTAFRSASMSIPIPSVVRLKYMVKVPFRARVPLTRRAILARDDHVCAYCTRTAQTIDHVIPRSRGGEHSFLNCVSACKRCNSAKDDKLLKEMPRGIEVKGKSVEKWALAFKPFQPRGTQWVIFGVLAETEPAWGPYLGVLPAPV